MTFNDYLRYVQQEATSEEAHAVRAWMADPSNAPLAQEWLKQYAELLEQEEGAAAEMPGFEAIQARLLAQLGLAPAEPATRRLSYWPRWAAAAALLLGLLTGGAWFWHSAHRLPLTTVATANREQRTVLLPDGSTVQLNGHSTLRYAADLAQQDTREVWMEGEGCFSVKHLPDHRRFVVHTSAGFNVEVLGTTFTVYRRHAQARVVLLTGKVRVDFADPARSDQVVLEPGELLETHDAQPQLIEHKAVDAALYAAWTENRLAFNETSLAEVATRLSDTYGVTVTLDTPALAQYKVTGTFPIGDLEAMLQFLEKSFPLTIQRQPNHFVISAHSSSLSQ
ncbi:DUF4974 domain-containing protein [Hymenobacter sp. HMF4947]|uniref:DUF4974 domain-containing protein n=1 Tax=Hymenobacter ginkgonis TaxID=2682976 RepID=A0A7K1TGP5_9BACT|nr:FecR domain-containing protein [Hymenobacter ginkgonis]MVN77554.1 DUF4974 domain-containing protein [Hymenobacter ginkgonis]